MQYYKSFQLIPVVRHKHDFVFPTEFKWFQHSPSNQGICKKGFPHNPLMGRNFKKRTRSRVFVEQFTTCSLDVQYLRWPRSDCTISRTKWYWRSKCLLRWLIDVLFVESIAPSLSIWMVTLGRRSRLCRFANSLKSQVDSFDASQGATHSASHVWFFDRQLIASPATKKTLPLVDFRVGIPKLRVPLMYLNTRFALTRSWNRKHWLCCEIFTMA